MDKVLELVKAAVARATDESVQVELTVPDEQFGDFATNVALQLSKKLGQNPREVAEKIVAELNDDSVIAETSIAGPGFINIRVTDEVLWVAASGKPTSQLSGQKILLEYSCPNPFKEMHTGHLYQTIVGDTIGRIFEASGAVVFRANFGGDVGLHVARCLWGIQRMLADGNPPHLDEVPEDSRAQWISQAYVLGAKADGEDEAAAAEIKALNKKIYEIHEKDDHESSVAQIYWRCREWSYNYFKDFYRDLAVTPFDKFYPESATVEPGLQMVKENIGTVFTESNGAVVFETEEKHLHTRVFITSEDLPTYEAKDLGVIAMEVKDFAYDRRIIITGNDQTEYMKVVFAALAEIDAELAAKQNHMANGTIRFGDGKKMSSRLGNVTRAVEVLDIVAKAVQADTPELRQDIMLGAVKYNFLKQRIGSDIAFDVTESVSLQGNSGPYLQYAHARARSILAKAPDQGVVPTELEAGERSLVRKLGQYAAVVQQATTEVAPHHICTYLYELSQVFNRFYENNRVLDDPRQNQRLALVERYADTLLAGLQLLNIPAPETM